MTVLYDYLDGPARENLMRWIKENPTDLKRDVDTYIRLLEKHYGAEPVKAQEELVFCTRPEEMLH